MAVLEQEPTETLEQYLEIAPTHSEVAIVLARRYQQMNRISDALHLLERAALANPQNIFLQHVWGDTLASIQRYDEAEEVYREAALTSMKSADWDKLGRELIAWGRLDKAEIALVRALTIEPVDPAAYYHLGQTYHLLGEPEKASKYLEMYLSIEPAGVYSDAARELLGE
jgi:tetratricopeptide (TPR) repeat protein